MTAPQLVFSVPSMRSSAFIEPSVAEMTDAPSTLAAMFLSRLIVTVFVVVVRPRVSGIRRKPWVGDT